MTHENYTKFKFQCLEIKLYGNTIMPIYLQIIFSCFCDLKKKSERNNCDRD